MTMAAVVRASIPGSRCSNGLGEGLYEAVTIDNRHSQAGVQGRRGQHLGDPIFEEHAYPATRGGPERDPGVNTGASDTDRSPPSIGPGNARLLDVRNGRLHAESSEGSYELSLSRERDAVLPGSGPQRAPDPEEPLIKVVRKKSVRHEAAAYSPVLGATRRPARRKSFPRARESSPCGGCQQSSPDARLLAYCMHGFAPPGKQPGSVNKIWRFGPVSAASW